MKCAAILIGAGLLVGCSQEQSSPAKPADAAAATPVASAAPAVAYPSHEGEPAGLYFETRKDGKTYVTGYVATAALIREGQVPAYVIEKTNFGPDGDTVVFETDGKGLDTRLEKEYLAQHKK
jgi:hypothetical protein